MSVGFASAQLFNRGLLDRLIVRVIRRQPEHSWQQKGPTGQRPLRFLLRADPVSELISDVAAPESLSEGRSNPFTSPGLPEPVTILEETPDGRPPQPGIWGSIAWTAAMPLGQLVIGMPIGLFIVLLISAITGSISSSGQMTALITGTQIGTVAFALVAAVVCSRFARHAMFPLAPIRILHLVALVAMVLPATMLSRTCYDLALALWNAATASLPALRAVDEMNTMEQIGGIVGAVPFPLLLLLLAVVPAVAEEIIFRGIIGRGLTARYGLVSGIIMTSMLFGIAHGHPAHAVSVIPLGIVMHVLYVATRSIWAPMLFHFCNNAFAIVGAHVLVQRAKTCRLRPRHYRGTSPQQAFSASPPGSGCWPARERNWSPQVARSGIQATNPRKRLWKSKRIVATRNFPSCQHSRPGWVASCSSPRCL